MTARAFFCWKPTIVILWFFGVVFALFAALNLWLLTRTDAASHLDPSYGDSRHLARILERGSIENGMIAALCILGWYFMRHRTYASLFAGALAVLTGLFVTIQRWLFWEIKGANPLSWKEPLFVWPFLVYVIVYAYRAGREQKSA